MFTRRDFIKTMSLLSGAVLAPVRWLGKWASQLPLGGQPVLAEDPPVEGELYAGFVLLPEGAPIPPFVSPSKLPELDRCGMVEGASAPERTAVIEYLNDLKEAKSKVNFPIYDFPKLPDGLRRGQPYIARDDLGNLYGVSIHYEALVLEDLWATTVSLLIKPDFRRPFPLWSSEPLELGWPSVVLEKVGFLPSPGIKISTEDGFVCYWIEKNTLYSLAADFALTIQDAEALFTLLEPV